MMGASTPLMGTELEVFLARLGAASPFHAGLLHRCRADVEHSSLPSALGDGSLLRVVIPARRKPVELLVVDADGELLVLGSASQLRALAQRRAVHLTTADAVADYLRFWCRVALRRSERVVEDVGDFRWIPAAQTDPELQARAAEASRLARWIAARRAPDGGHLAEATVLEQRTLQLRAYHVAADGEVAELSRTTIANDVPVPYLLP